MPWRGAVALVTTVLAVVLLFGFKPAEQNNLAANIPPSPVGGQPHATPAPIAAGQATGQPPAQASPTSPPNPAGATGTFTGAAIQTAYGTVQIALQVQNGKIVDVQELQMPSDRRLSAQISAEAGPMLRDEVLRAQSANIDGVSGASYTSYGFWKSLQSAIAQIQ